MVPDRFPPAWVHTAQVQAVLGALIVFLKKEPGQVELMRQRSAVTLCRCDEIQRFFGIHLKILT